MKGLEFRHFVFLLFIYLFIFPMNNFQCYNTFPSHHIVYSSTLLEYVNRPYLSFSGQQLDPYHLIKKLLKF